MKTLLAVALLLVRGYAIVMRRSEQLDANTAPMRPKATWEEPLSAEEEAEFDKDMHTPIKRWLQENPDLNSDYFVKFGMSRGYSELGCWENMHVYNAQASGVGTFFTHPNTTKKQPRGPRVTWNVEGTTITSRHVMQPSTFADDAYCWTLGWLQGQSLNGSLMLNAKAWEALVAQECNKLGQALAGEFPEENHTVYHHVMWNRIWPGDLRCNVVEGHAPSMGPWFGPQELNSSTCTLTGRTPMTKTNMREHAYRKCILGMGNTEAWYCYTRGCLLNGNEIGHGAECPDELTGWSDH